MKNEEKNARADISPAADITAAPALKTAALTKRFRGFCLDGVSLTLPRGCTLGLIGENRRRHGQAVRARHKG